MGKWEMGKEKSSKKLTKELEKRNKEIRAELGKRSKKSANPSTSSFETVMLNNALSQNKTLGRLLERSEGIRSMSKCVYVLTAEVSVILTIAIAIAVKLIAV